MIGGGDVQRYKKIGLGLAYKPADFSNDLRVVGDYSDYGWYMHVQGKY